MQITSIFFSIKAHQVLGFLIILIISIDRANTFIDYAYRKFFFLHISMNMMLFVENILRQNLCKGYTIIK